jgi:LDH2 family malate/lactate/ureidoglycolate dehydrogenase
MKVKIDVIEKHLKDAAAALGDDGVANLLSIGGGFKGYGLVMLVEIMTGSLVRRDPSANSRWR